ncbi:putative pyranose oxidase [Mycena rebaudengoi]|nr:putative pyranose oxidase [Mycena rebaudengoi]
MPLTDHEVHNISKIAEFDVFIAGSGPIGATYARLLVDAGYSVVMVEIGDQETQYPGGHKKNEIVYQKDIDRFVRVIQGDLSTVSIPRSKSVMPTLDPAAWSNPNGATSIVDGRNQHQDDFNNLPAEAVTRTVGGMSSHWTCATPEFKVDVERPKIFSTSADDDAEWTALYNAAKMLIGTSETEFTKSIRHNVVLNALKNAYGSARTVKALPLACHRLAAGSPYVQWHAADNIFGDMFDPKQREKKNKANTTRGKFYLLPNTRCTKLHLYTGTVDPTNINIEMAEVQDLYNARLAGTDNAPTFIIAAGAIGTPQILANSGWGGMRKAITNPAIPRLGEGITEQPMAFCQIVLKRELVDAISNETGKEDWWKEAVAAHKKDAKDDPLPIPFHDPEPQVTIPVSKERPWHAQIHRDAFSYGEAGPKVDPRLVVDLRFFGRQAGIENNKLITTNKLVFEDDDKDGFGMPQPTFEYRPTTKYAEEAHLMMDDMTDVANKLGGYLPDSYPQFMAPGLALHIGGTVRLGTTEDKGISVANYNSKVWNFKNLYVGGNGTIPTAFAANPTLTSIALAIRSAYTIKEYLLKLPAKPADTIAKTPAEWLNWATDKTDPNYPNHTAREGPRVIT